ncbi:class III lanthionine synthetase LanKC [Cystobacter ferrugineus]|uniref:Protein kinase domain-containing protein n=1 Tax=Cystobacter ferrugineus TaxID=83449 RepID=A0A1L9B424_9BACT|nr:class III lanthionine synthetase LanKC [Cystobacter ferrugineus]OJH36998.1 hypothetical protein BON30_31430 [Cystobacter ferrugineus]
MRGIERRARENIRLFTLLHPERYGSLDGYQSKSAGFRELLVRLLPASWTIGRSSGIWCEAHPLEPSIPDTGFKIHVSTAHDRARELLAAVVPLLVSERVAFKVLVDEFVLDLSNSHMWARGASGKFITIYPADVVQMKRLMEQLHGVTKDFVGPYILSDKRYKGSHVLFYRYGAFRGLGRLNAYGEQVPHLRTTDGRLLPDPRPPFFTLPPGVDDPFPDDDQGAAGEPILHGRYKALSAMSSSSKGGVYRCLDLTSRVEVVLKEARPLVNRGRKNPCDAVDCLENEYRILKRLEATGLAPRALDFFQDWEHSFLVMELVRGSKLSAHMASGQLSLIASPTPGADEVRRFCETFLAVSRKLITALRTIHSRGVVIQDISPKNILFDLEHDQLTFIDFEAALDLQNPEQGPVIRLFTPGFGVERPAGPVPTFREDHQALSRVLGDFLYPPTPFFMLAPHQREPMLTHFAQEKGIPEAFVRLIFGIEQDFARADELLAEAERSLGSIHSSQPLPLRREEDALRESLDGIIRYITDQIHSGEDPLDLPTDYRRFTTNRLSAAYGASGIALFLQRVGKPPPEVFLEALLRESSQVDNQRYAPGLYIGSAGIAWTLLELGWRKEAEALLEVAAHSPLLFENADLFYGGGGFGLTNLFFFDRLGDEKYLQRAIQVFDTLKPGIQSSEQGYFFENNGDVYHGLAHGASGLAYFCLKLHQATGRQEHLDAALRLLDFDLSSADRRKGHPRFHRSRRESVFYPYWHIGSAGIGCVALRFYDVLRDERYAQESRSIAASLAGNYSVFPTNFTGMAGLGGFFVDLYRYTGEEVWRTEARRFLDRVMLFALERPTGLVFPGEDLLRVSTDYGTGSAGTGSFIHRLLTGSGIPYLDF